MANLSGGSIVAGEFFSDEGKRIIVSLELKDLILFRLLERLERAVRAT